MLNKIFIILNLLNVYVFVLPLSSSAQVVIGDIPQEANPSAVLELQSTTKGFLPPRLTTDQRNAIAEPANGMVVYNTTLNCLELYSASSWTCLANHESTSIYPPRLSYNEIQALSSPQPGDMVYDLDFNCMRYYIEGQWLATYNYTGDYDLDGRAWTAGGTGSLSGSKIAMDQQGNLYVVGGFEGTVSFGESSVTAMGGWDIYVAKYSPLGTLLWVRAVGGYGAENALGIVIDGAGKVYITGGFSSTVLFGTTQLSPIGGQDIFVAKLSAEGDFEWAQRAGGDGGDAAKSIALDKNGQIYITGSFQWNSTFGNITVRADRNEDIFIAKLTPDGTFTWVQKAGGQSYNSGATITVDNQDNIYVAGHFYREGVFGPFKISVNGSGAKTFITKLNKDGNFIWAKQLDGASYNYGRMITTDKDGNVLLAGVFDVSANFDGTVLSSAGGSDGYILKLTAEGALQWFQKVGGKGSDDLAAIRTTDDGTVYVAGQFIFDATVGAKKLVASRGGKTDILLLKYTPQGSLLWVQKDGGVGAEYVFDLVVKDQSTLYVTGIFQSILQIRNSIYPAAGQLNQLFIAHYLEQKPVSK